MLGWMEPVQLCVLVRVFIFFAGSGAFLIFIYLVNAWFSRNIRELLFHMDLCL